MKTKSILLVVGVIIITAVLGYWQQSKTMTTSKSLVGQSPNSSVEAPTNLETKSEGVNLPDQPLTVDNQESNMTDTNQTTDQNDSSEEAMTDTTVSNEDSMVSTISSPAPVADSTARATAMVAGGCFWCVEADLEKLQGVIEVVSGYAGGTSENPTYGNYSKNGHREVVEVTYNPTVVSFREIVIYALKHMDPTDADGSFYDRGVEYAPAFYYSDGHDKQIIEEVIASVDALDVYDKPVAARVEPTPKFWRAEDYHQDYYKGALSKLKYKYYRNGSGRDKFIEENWGDDTGPTLPSDTVSYDLSAWTNFVAPSDAELQSQLSAMQYKVAVKSGTEPSFSNEYWDNKEEGIYVDIVSGEPLYSSTDKFDSGTGWPSFTKAIYAGAVTEYADYKLIIKRTEVRSTFGDSHLGHIFNDAPAELGGIRHCINSASLRFVAKIDMAAEGYGEFLSLFE